MSNFQWGKADELENESMNKFGNKLLVHPFWYDFLECDSSSNDKSYAQQVNIFKKLSIDIPLINTLICQAVSIIYFSIVDSPQMGHVWEKRICINKGQIICVLTLFKQINYAPVNRPAWDSMAYNSLLPSDAIRRHGSGSILAQVMVCCLTAPSHYLKQLMLTYHQWGLMAFFWGQFHKRCFRHQSLKLDWKSKFPLKCPRGQWINLLK